MNPGEESKSSEMVTLKFDKYTKAAELCLRFMAMGVTLAATCIVLTSNETVVVYGITATAKYSYSPSYKFFAAANLIASVFSAISFFAAYILDKKSKSKSINYFYFFLHDLVVMTLLIAGCAAATAIGYLGRYGNKYAGWIAICGYLDKYCNNITISVSFSYIGFLFYFILTIISATKSNPTTTTTTTTTQVIKSLHTTLS